MNRERRSKCANDRKEPTPPPPEPEHDSDSTEHSSNEYINSVKEYEETYFPIPTRRMYRYFLNLKQKDYENTRTVSMDTLCELVVDRDFLRLTSRIGFSPDFWSIEANSYSEYTIEFLSSIQIMRDQHDVPFIKFRLGRQTHGVQVRTLSKWFGFYQEPETDELSFRRDLTKEQFWGMLTGMRGPTNKDYKARYILHPVLRIIQRALACTIFVRGETVSRVNNEDLMLRPDSELERPDLMIIMIQHWLGLQSQKRAGGYITCCVYVTFIAEKLQLQLIEADTYIGPTSIDTDSLRLAEFIRTERGPAGHNERHFWCMPDGTERSIPFEAPISFIDDRTWRLDPLVEQHAPTAQTGDDANMEEAPGSSHQVPGSSSHSHSDLSLQDVYKLMRKMSDHQRQQGIYLKDRFDNYGSKLNKIDKRLAKMESEFRAWRLAENRDQDSDDNS